jgi:ferric-dicitrate binding protein FerR (iron transport regulator)
VKDHDPMNQKLFGSNEETALLRRLADGELQAQEFESLQDRLLRDDAFRASYVRFMDLEANLYDVLEKPVVASGPGYPPTHRGRLRSALLVVGTLLAAVLVGATIFALNMMRNQALVDGASTRKPTARPETRFIESDLKGHKDVAIVIQVEEAATAKEGDVALRAGMRLKPGVLTVGKGLLQLEFVRGAVVVLQGPAEIHLLSADTATLIGGRAWARVPEAARGFVLNAPDAAIVDLGTEFAVAVDDQGDSEVHVLEGEVEVSLLGDDGNTLRNERLLESNTLRVSADESSLESVEMPSVKPPTIERKAPAPIVVTPDYVQEVMAGRPAIYWRFESAVNGVVPNEVGPEFAAVIHDGIVPSVPGKPADAPVETMKAAPLAVVENGVVRFSSGNLARWVGPDVAVPGLNSGSYSIEFWVRPDMLQTATLAGVMPEGELWANSHLNVIELCNQTSLVHAPGSFRFLHRHPPNAKGGLNLFSEGGFTPMQWHHLVAVNAPDTLRLYLNGKLVRSLTKLPTIDSVPYHVCLGQLKPQTLERQLVGSIDEFALYRRELSAEEVSRHYELLMGPRSRQ